MYIRITFYVQAIMDDLNSTVMSWQDVQEEGTINSYSLHTINDVDFFFPFILLDFDCY